MAGPLLESPRVWTIDDLGDLPDNAHYEIVDGHLLVSPPPTLLHDSVGDEFRDLLACAVGDRRRIAGPVGISFGADFRVPDLIVMVPGIDRARRGLLVAEEVILAVEIVSPGSTTTDRLLKPAQYAAAGIRGYWRVETDPEMSLTAYSLDSDASVYRELGTWSGEEWVEIAEPIVVSFGLGELVP